MLNKQYIGIDPSLRHTGICVIQSGTSPRFWEIKTEGFSVYEVGRHISRELQDILGMVHQSTEATVFGIERQVPNSGILFHSMMEVISTLMNFYGLMSPNAHRCMALPLPIQLKSFMIKQMGLEVTSKKRIVEQVTTKYVSVTNRLSQHKAEAYCLAVLAQQVSDGLWTFNLPTKETPLVPQSLVLGRKQNAFAKGANDKGRSQV